MGISEKKMQIVINNYFKQECDVNTSIREAFEKGFRIGVKKGLSVQPERKRGEWEEIEVIADAYDISGVKTWASKMKCDQCGFTTIAIEGRFSQYNFCPNCGADMRGNNDA